MVAEGLSAELLDPDRSLPVGAALFALSDVPEVDAEPVAESVALDDMLPPPDRESVAVPVGTEESAVVRTDVLADPEP